MASFTEREIQYLRDCIAALPSEYGFFKGEIYVEDDHIDIADGNYSLYVEDTVKQIKTLVGVKEVPERVYSATVWKVSGYSYGYPDDVSEFDLVEPDTEFHRVLCKVFADPAYRRVYELLPTLRHIFADDGVFLDGE
jgi:hypothetical protein